MARSLIITLAFAAYALHYAYAQTRLIDSLKKEVASQPQDSALIENLNRLTWDLKNFGLYDEGLIYATRALQLSEKLRHASGLINSYSNLGLLYAYKGNYPLAIANQLRSLQYAEQAGRAYSAGNALSNLGNVYQQQGNYEKALEYQQKALRLRQQIIEKGGNLKDSIALGNSWGNIGIIYSDLGKTDTALACYRRSLELMRQCGSIVGEANALNNIATCYLDMDSMQAALGYFNAALPIYRKIGYRSGEGTTLSNIAEVYVRLGDAAKAEPYALQSLQVAEETGELDGLEEAHMALSMLYELKDNYPAALRHFMSYIAARDSLKNEENTKRSVQLEMQYEFEKREAAVKLEQEKKDAVAAADKHRQQIILVVISGFGLLVLGFAVFAYRSYLQKKKANVEILRQKLLIEHKQKEILDSIYYARRIQRSLLPHDAHINKTMKRLRV